MSTFRSRALASGLAALAVFPAAAVATPPEVPSGVSTSSMYSPPSSSIPGTPGSVVWWRTMPATDEANLGSLSGSARPNATAKRVIYRSVAIDGTANVDSATVFTPAGAPPAGGWKVVSWNHVTTGGADLCAPSRATANLPGTSTANPEYERLTRSDELIAGLLNRGLVVVRVDYEGIGTPGPHPYLIDRSLARTNVNAVRATRELVPSTTTEWAVAGQSEGGIAALSTSKYAPTYAPELTLKATLSATPPVDNKTLVFEVGTLLPFGSGLSSMGGLMLNGARLASPALGAAYPSYLTSEGATRMGDLESLCLAQLGAGSSLGGLSFAQIYGPTASQYKAALYAELDRNDPRFIDLGSEPIRFYAGSLDGVAWQSKINDVVDLQKAAHPHPEKVTYKTYLFGTHVNITDNAQGGVDMANWLKAQLG
ncbi:MAG: hypothetical protein JHD16_04165 [Solirubrobacteraceae bacterium]|nr:hypothetical protein [Solirubrobacteraceae bacterium]